VTRGFRGATTVTKNVAAHMMQETKELILQMVRANGIKPEDISHVFFSVTADLNAAFPAKVARELPGWSHVPVMCMQEIDVPGSLCRCIRIMLVAKTTLKQEKIEHIFLNEAVRLRPDLTKEGE
jgi:chorismate mutase